MKIGLNAAYLVNRELFKEQERLVLHAESIGYDSVWTAEAYGSDAGSPLAYLAAKTEKIKLGSAIFQIPGRTPANCAMVSTTIDNLSDGRFILGLGSSGPQVAEGWHGQPFAKQLLRTREYVTILRMMLGREKAEFHGELYELPLPDGLGKALKIMLPPVQERIPIYLAAIGPKNTQLAGEICDGWLPYLYAPENAELLNSNLREGAERGGRTLADVAVTPTVFAATGEGDLDELRDRMRPILALYIGGMGARGKNFYNTLVSSYGFEDAATVVQDLYLDKKYDEAGAAVPVELIDLVSLIGSKDAIADRIAAYGDVGVDQLLIAPLAYDEAGRRDILETVAEAAS